MDKNSEVDSFLDGLDEGQEDPLKPVVEDLFPEKEEKVEEKEEKPLPFNKDPKVQKFIEKEISKRIADLQPQETERFVRETTSSKEEQDEILESLTEIVGNDTPQKVSAVNRLRKALAGSEERAISRAVQELQTLTTQEREAESQADREAETELSEGFESIEEQFNVDLTSETGQARRLRNEFIEFIERVAPKDHDGQVVEYPDFEETFKLFKDTRKPTNTRAKELASRGMTRSGDTSATVPTGAKSWKDVDRLFSKLNK